MVHGDFEAMVKGDEIPPCPEGCDVVVRAFRTPPGFRSDRTRNIDATVDNLAKQHGMTDISNRGGRAAKRADPNAERNRAELQNFMREKYGDGWGKIPEGGSYNVQTGKVEGSGPGVGGALANYHAPAANTVGDVKDALVKKPVVYRHDHENLKISDARPPA